MAGSRAWVAILSICTLACAQTPAPNPAAPPPDTRTLAQRLAGFDIKTLKTLQPGDQKGIALAIDPQKHFRAFLLYQLPPQGINSAFADFLKTVESARVDQQLGNASPASGAGTSTVAQTGLTSLVSMAFASGALTQTIDQNAVTLHANGDGLYRFVTNQPVIPVCVTGDTSCQPGWAKNLDLSATFNVSGAGTQTLTGTTASNNTPAGISALLNKHEFSSATVQYAIWNDRDLRSSGYQKSFMKWFQQNKAQLSAAGQKLDTAIAALLNKYDTLADKDKNNPDALTPYQQWIVQAAGEVAKALAPNSSITVEQAVAAQFDDLITKVGAADSQYATNLQNLSQAYVSFFTAKQQLGENMITAPQFLVQATYSEPMLQPKIINTKLSYAWSPGTGSRTKAAACTSAATPQSGSCGNPGTVTVNFGADLYQTPQPTGVATSTSRFRDVQAAFQFDGPIGSATSPAQFSLGGYYQYQPKPGVFMVPSGATTVPNTDIPLPPNGATILTNTRGSLFVVQAVVTVQIASAGVKVPIGISWSNKTDLVNGNEVRAHIGFTFNSEGALLSSASSK